MTTETPTLDQVLDLAHKLPREQRGQLISRLVLELATPESVARPPSPEDPWQRLDRLREEFRALGPSTPSMSEQLERDRHERDQSLMGRWADQPKDDDVHP